MIPCLIQHQASQCLISLILIFYLFCPFPSPSLTLCFLSQPLFSPFFFFYVCKHLVAFIGLCNVSLSLSPFLSFFLSLILCLCLHAHPCLYICLLLVPKHRVVQTGWMSCKPCQFITTQTAVSKCLILVCKCLCVCGHVYVYKFVYYIYLYVCYIKRSFAHTYLFVYLMVFSLNK